MDTDGLLQCPYDKNHRIRPSRFPYHLVKCRESNRLVAKELAICPYNARHRVPKQELQLHMATCENKVALELPAFMEPAGAQSAWKSPPCEENWEDEASMSKTTPFICGFSNIQPFDEPINHSQCNTCKCKVSLIAHGELEPLQFNVLQQLFQVLESWWKRDPVD
ncbi:protein D7-like [Pelodytes ibericus]